MTLASPTRWLGCRTRPVDRRGSGGFDLGSTVSLFAPIRSFVHIRSSGTTTPPQGRIQQLADEFSGGSGVLPLWEDETLRRWWF
jgi:hypothetical protein